MYGDREGVLTRQVVSIDSVNTERWVATGLTRYQSRITISLDIMWGGNLTVPSLGDQWVVEKVLGVFVLVARVGFQDERRLLKLQPGDTVVGARGTTHLFGSEVVSQQVDLTDVPSLTLKTYRALSVLRQGTVDFEIPDGSPSLDYQSGLVTPYHPGKYMVSCVFYSPGSLKVLCGGQVVGETVQATTYSQIVRVLQGQSVGVELIPQNDIPVSTERPSGTMSMYWVGR